MKMIAMEYLHDVLKPVMDELISANRSCEIDATRLEKGEELEANRTVLTAYIEWTANRIFGAALFNFAVDCGSRVRFRVG